MRALDEIHPGIPTVLGAEAGHTDPQVIVPIGLRALTLIRAAVLSTSCNAHICCGFRGSSQRFVECL